MTTRKQGLSLKYKLLALLITLPVISLALYLLLATRLFESDKIAYVFDSSAAVSRTLATQVRAESDSVINYLRPIIEDFHGSFGKTARTLFRKDDKVRRIEVFSPARASIGKLSKESDSASVRKEYLRSVSQLIENARVHQAALQIDSARPGQVLIAVREGKKSGSGGSVFIASVKLENFTKVFSKATTYAGYLVSPSGQVLMGPEDSERWSGRINDFSTWRFFSEVSKKNLPEGTAEVTAPDGQALLASYSRVGTGSMVTIALVRKADALRAVSILLWKSLLFFVALISFAVITSVFASGQLTSTLSELQTATQQVAEGKFDINVEVRSNDEVGSLADSFNRMGAEITRLMSETAEKARMEKELETARTVQETLFPEPKFKSGPLRIVGFYTPASECGGDWWHYSVIGDKVFLWIGDATGHGAPAALITSAAKSAAAVIERMAGVTPGKAMELLNNAIYETSKGQMLMTFFVASFDKKTGELVYANASHDPPYVLKHTGQPLTKNDLEPLNEVNNPRLGEQKNIPYKESKIKLAPGDSIMFYTDGASDIRNTEGKPWGERNFLKCVVSAVSEAPVVDDAVERIRTRVEEYRGGTTLPDDVTFFMCRYEDAA